MKQSGGLMSIICGIIAAILVFTPLFNTPPLAITIFGVLGILLGAMNMKKAKETSIVGVIISALSLVYLIILFAGLAT